MGMQQVPAWRGCPGTPAWPPAASACAPPAPLAALPPRPGRPAVHAAPRAAWPSAGSECSAARHARGSTRGSQAHGLSLHQRASGSCGIGLMHAPCQRRSASQQISTPAPSHPPAAAETRHPAPALPPPTPAAATVATGTGCQANVHRRSRSPPHNDGFPRRPPGGTPAGRAPNSQPGRHPKQGTSQII